MQPLSQSIPTERSAPSEKERMSEAPPWRARVERSAASRNQRALETCAARARDSRCGQELKSSRNDSGLT